MKLTLTPPYPISFHFLIGMLLLPIIAMLMESLIFSGPYYQETKLAPGTDNYIKQTALHLSKLLGGVSVGGFPGFEPPKEDKKYREKIKNQQLQPHEINGWVREINNFLQQIVDKNPNLTLTEILKQLGKSPAEIKDFLDSLRNLHAITRGYVNYGVNQATFDTLEVLMERLGVVPW